VHIAVVGSGIAGLATAWLLGRQHRVDVFEAEGRAGGHAHTHTVTDADGTWPIDTGFMVYNERTYPTFVRMLAALGIETRPSDMSFSVRCRRCGLEYSSRGLRGWLAQPWRLVDPRHVRTLADTLRFFRAGRRFLAGPPDESLSLGAFIERERLSATFARHFLLPMGGAIWSASGTDVRAFPAHAFLRFFDNHGLLAIDDAPVWRTIAGGSRRYVQAMSVTSGARMRMGQPVRRLRRGADGVHVATDEGTTRYDQVVIATHADTALGLLADPSDAERTALGRVRYSRNRTVLHADAAMLPTRTAARASWNCDVADCRDETAPVSLTYDVSRLQGIGKSQRYCVTLNGTRTPSGPVHAVMDYTHPVMNADAFRSQRDMAQMNGTNRTWYAGAWLRYGFHEDGVVSAVRVAEGLGVRW
jgi:predicted NAD/FAD-binding protein